MDAAAHQALRDAVRQAITPDLDALSAELERVNVELSVLRRKAGLDGDRLAPDDRRRQVALLRAQGCPPDGSPIWFTFTA